jgi:hypothetical protein
MEDVITIGDLEIWPEDLGEMTWHEANTEVAKLGPDWRLPTIEEFREVLYPNRERLFDEISFAQYWSSAENYHFSAWNFKFYNGYSYPTRKNLTYYVRAVRDFTVERVVADLLKEF